MEWTLFTKEDYKTTLWSGGVTTQLAISPEGAEYAGRDFLWRLSSASVQLDHSDFTPLPDYNRLLTVLEGEIRLKIGRDDPVPLAPGEVVAFDGGVPVESWGKCVDFNLMLRKGRAKGELTVLHIDRGQKETWTPPAGDLAVYCVAGDVRLPRENLEVRAGEFLLCRDAGGGPVRLEGSAGIVILAGIEKISG